MTADNELYTFVRIQNSFKSPQRGNHHCRFVIRSFCQIKNIKVTVAHHKWVMLDSVYDVCYTGVPTLVCLTSALDYIARNNAKSFNKRNLRNPF